MLVKCSYNSRILIVGLVYSTVYLVHRQRLAMYADTVRNRKKERRVRVNCVASKQGVLRITSRSLR